MDIYIGRQPILDRQQNVYGYELLYRNHESSTQAVFYDGDQATLNVILNAFLEIGTNNLIGNGYAFVNLTGNFLTGKFPIPLPPNQTVIEVLEDTSPDPVILNAMRNLYRQGYKIALDDVTNLERVMPFLPMIHLVKIDIQAAPADTLPGMVQALKRYNLQIVAEKVETQDEFYRCSLMGFDLFQGFFFCKPNVFQRRKMSSSRIVVMQALAKLQDPNVQFSSIEKIVSADVFLSYKLLLLVNSGYYSLKNEVKSIRQALAYIGVNQLRSWMSLLILSNLQRKPHELASVALVRASMAERIARALSLGNPEVFYMTGLFSVLDAYLDTPMTEVVKEVELDSAVSEALVEGKGKLGSVLTAITQFEQGNFEMSKSMGLLPETMNQIFSESVTHSAVLSSLI